MNILKKSKLLIIITVAILAVGIILASVIGFNNSSDYSNGYEVYVSVDQNVKGSSKIVKDATEEYLKKENVSFSKYATETLNEGESYIFKIKDGSKLNETAFNQFVNDKLDANSETERCTAEVKVYETKVTSDTSLGFIALAIGISAVIAFIYLLFMEKVSSALSVFSVSIASPLLFVALFGITRLPIVKTLGVGVALSFIFSAIVSTVLVNRYKETLKIAGNEKMESSEVVSIGAVAGLKRVLFIAVALLFASAIFMGLGFANANFLFLGVQLLIADIVSIYSGYCLTPLIYNFVKK